LLNADPRIDLQKSGAAILLPGNRRDRKHLMPQINAG
jgi:hypothetical protein